MGYYRSRTKRHSVRKYFLYFRLRRGHAFTFRKYQIPRALFSGFASASFLKEIRSVILKRNKTTCANTDTRLDHNGFFKENRNRQIAARESRGCDDLEDFP